MEEDVYATLNYSDSDSTAEDGAEDEDGWNTLDMSVEQLEHLLLWQLPDSGNGTGKQTLANWSFSNETAMPSPSSTPAQSPFDTNNYWALLALVLVFGTAAGNILVCLAIAWERRLQNVTNYFLMSLAITDLMVAVLVMPLGILTLVKGKSAAAAAMHIGIIQ